MLAADGSSKIWNEDPSNAEKTRPPVEVQTGWKADALNRVSRTTGRVVLSEKMKV
jgi:hypothetical protein